MKSLRNYCTPSFTSALVVALMIILSGTLFIAIASKYCDEYEMIGLYFSGVVCCVLAIYVIIRMYVWQRYKFETRMNEYKNDYSSELIEADFKGSRSFLNDNIRAGRYFIYSHKNGELVSLNEITSIGIHRRQVDLDTSWQIKVGSVKRSFVLHTLKSSSKGEWDEFIEYINMAAPNINVEEMTFYVQKGEYIPPMRGFPITRK